MEARKYDKGGRCVRKSAVRKIEVGQLGPTPIVSAAFLCGSGQKLQESAANVICYCIILIDQQ